MDPFFWWLFLILIFLLGIFSKVYLLAAAAVMLAVIGLLARWWLGRALEQLSYTRRLHYRRGFPGEKIELRLEVENRKFLPVSWLRIQDPWPAAVGPEDASLLAPTENPELGSLINLFSLRWYERSRRPYTLLLRKRGVYPLGPACLESGDLFGMFSQEQERGPVNYLTVFPEPLPMDSLRLPAEGSFGDRRARRRLYEDPTQPMGVRDYHPEDDFRHIHWLATAHTGQMQTRVYQPISTQVMMICLNVSTLQHYWEGYYPELLEHLVRVAATLVQRGLQEGYRVGLTSNGSLAHADQPFRVPPGRSKQQYARLLETLAGVTPFTTAAFERFMDAEAPRLPYGAALVVVSGLLPLELAETLLRLKKHGHPITLLSFARTPPPSIPGVQVIHLPFGERA